MIYNNFDVVSSRGEPDPLFRPDKTHTSFENMMELFASWMTSKSVIIHLNRDLNMSLEVEKESIELKVSLKTWLQLILTLVISGFLLFLVLSFIMPLIWRLAGPGID